MVKSQNFFWLLGPSISILQDKIGTNFRFFAAAMRKMLFFAPLAPTNSITKSYAKHFIHLTCTWEVISTCGQPPKLPLTRNQQRKLLGNRINLSGHAEKRTFFASAPSASIGTGSDLFDS